MRNQPYRQVIRLKDTNGEYGTFVLTDRGGETLVESYWCKTTEARLIVPSLLMCIIHVTDEPMIKVKALSMLSALTQGNIEMTETEDNDDLPF